MLGDAADMARRLRLVLPQNWFGDTTPILDAALTGAGSAMAAVYSLIQAVRVQSRILTATGMTLDVIAADFFGIELFRRPGEGDTQLRSRIIAELLRDRGTRAALVEGIFQATGKVPAVFEPARPEDTGGYNFGGVGYCSGGGWGNLNLPYQVFLTVYRPSGGGIAALAGYGSGGIPVYGNLDMVTLGETDQSLMADVSRLLPVGTIAWCRISS